jgi:adenine-specific DNA-methyltransferase
MTSLLENERLGGQVQVVYPDPPYGINFNSNFQARISNRSPKETQDAALTREPEQVQAYRAPGSSAFTPT